MRILTAARMREADRLTTEKLGIPSLQLMGNAGAGVVTFLQKEVPDLSKRRIMVLCGKGNNGGDGFVVARSLKQLGANPTVIIFAEPKAVRGDAAINLELWRKSDGVLIPITETAIWKEGIGGSIGVQKIIVDALLGTGLTGPVTGLLAEVIQTVNHVSSRA